MTDGWMLAARARRDYADLVEPLIDRAEERTLAGGWTVHHVTAHLASFVDVGLPRFFLNMARHRFDYDRAADALARREAQRPMAELIASLRDKAEQRSAIPTFPGEMTATDVVVHTQDVSRGLRLDRAPDAELVETALVFLSTDKKAGAIVGKGKYDGLRFESTDGGWSHGNGLLVAGPAETLMMAMAGRPVWDELSGDGVTTLRDRFG
jgi:uncharacterized protein (TIGR03083 family)